ncbi:MAG: S8 family serine peptidase, partial [candidate division Zixibacteria bacterium]|nr:S8 family serine peptidase [candidate division Zixibacteria bacterium]
MMGLSRKLLSVLSICFFALIISPISGVSLSKNKTSDSRIILKKRVPASKSTHISINQKTKISHVVIKFKDNYKVRSGKNRLYSKLGLDIQKANEYLTPHYNNNFRRLFNNKSVASNDRKKEILQGKSHQELADLNSYYFVNVQNTIEAENLINNLNDLNYVEIAYFEPTPEPAGDIDPPTPDYQPNQDYREAAPAGVDADYLNTLPGGNGSGVKIIDIEGGWQDTHEDLDKAFGGLIAGEMLSDPSWTNHGTAVIGEMIAGDNGYGVTGICPGADIGMVSIGSLSTAEALITAADTLNPGDVILIELHAPGPHYNFENRPDQLGYVCMEYWQANFDAIVYAWTKGIIVVEAAGNGAEDFDDIFIYNHLFDTTSRNSHAIIVGAGYPASSSSNLQKHGFSNYGERVNLQGYGSGVYTTGYGGLFDGGGDEDQYYTSSFSGTSSASPIVTGAVTCLQGYYKANNIGAQMTSDQIRDALVSTGTPQLGNTTEHIGPRPDLLGAISVLPNPMSIYTNPIVLDTVLDEGESAL